MKGESSNDDTNKAGTSLFRHKLAEANPYHDISQKKSLSPVDFLSSETNLPFEINKLKELLIRQAASIITSEFDTLVGNNEKDLESIKILASNGPSIGLKIMNQITATTNATLEQSVNEKALTDLFLSPSATKRKFYGEDCGGKKKNKKKKIEENVAEGYETDSTLPLSDFDAICTTPKSLPKSNKLSLKKKISLSPFLSSVGKRNKFKIPVAIPGRKSTNKK